MPQAALYRHKESWILQTSSPSFLPMLLHLTVSQYLVECFVNAHCKGTIEPPFRASNWDDGATINHHIASCLFSRWVSLSNIFSNWKIHTRQPLERLNLVHGAIERLEQSITAQGNRDANSTSQSCNYPFLDHVIKLKGTYLVLQHPQSGQWL
jgi:hypothetical protein